MSLEQSNSGYNGAAAGASGSPGPEASLVAFFAKPGNRTLQPAKRALIRAIGELETQQDRIANLSAESIRVQGEGKSLSVSLSDHPSTRLTAYEDPRPGADAWYQNQYAVGVSFHEALSRGAGAQRGQHAAAVPIEDFVKELAGGFSNAIAKMTSTDPERRFQTPRAAIRVVLGISEFDFLRWMRRAAVVFVLLVGAMLAYTFDPSFRWLRRGAGPNAAPRAVIHQEAMPAAEPSPSGEVHAGMVLVPGGTVEIAGSARPIRAFYMDGYEVSIGKYQAYARAEGRKLPFGDSPYSQQFPDHPVWNVSWQDASDYCAKDRHKRLPTEWEWERATGTAAYAWGGGNPEAGQANVDSGVLADVGVNEHDRTAGGIFDLAGNLPEWMRDASGSGSLRVVRGGGYYLPASMSRERFEVEPEPDRAKGFLRIGFRCVIE